VLNVGDTAPPFSVLDHTGKNLTLESFLGKKVILWFYPKADTPGCTAEGCAFRDRQEDFHAKNAVLLGVSFDTPKENAAFAKKYGFEFPLLCDTSKSIGVAYGACASASDTYAKRIAYVIDEKGIVETVYPKVDAASFPETVLQKI
jgi:thioredoxin-dependent peroxiredoxin